MIRGRPVIRSLAAVGRGESVEIRRILFGSLRALCHELGVREGAVVRCRSDDGARVWLDAEHRTVALERGWARFIQVEPVRPGPITRAIETGPPWLNHADRGPTAD